MIGDSNMQNNKSPGRESEAFKGLSAFEGADNRDYTQNEDGWQAAADNQQLCTDLTDFLNLNINQYGVDDDLAKAVSFVKHQSEVLAYGYNSGGREHG